MKISRLIMFVAMTLFGFIAATAAPQDVLVSTRNTTLLLYAHPGDPLRIAYYGPRITENEGSQLWWIGDAIATEAYPSFSNYCPDECAISVEHADGQVAVSLVVEGVERKNADGGELITIHTKDRKEPLRVDVCYRTYTDADMIETWTEISHSEKRAITLRQFASGTLPIKRGDVWVSHLHGQWGNECALTEEPLNPGMLVIKDRNGARTNHSTHSELMLSLDGRPSETTGRTIGAALCWTGNFKLRIDTDTNDSPLHRLTAGIDDTGIDYKLDPGKTFRTPELAFTYTNEGKGGVSRNFHRWAREYKMHNGLATRDVLLNSWEGIYLDITEEKMHRLMDGVAEVGGELIVMDDGWFASPLYNRDRDNAALGDWDVDTRKLPHGVSALVDEAKKRNLKFGIWIEPEMGNYKASRLWDEHPDWFLQNTGRDMQLERGGTQAVIDLCNPKVQDFVFGIVDKLMTDNPSLAYIKWDCNAAIRNYGSTYLPKDRQAQVYIDYHFGLRRVLERIRAKYPQLVIQACASGGGRCTYGAMPYFDEVWTSDNTDALQRVSIQWGTSMFYPASAMGAHVSASPNHQTGRRIPLKYRFDVAMSGRLGIEMKPSDFSADEMQFARQAVASYKQLRDVVQLGDLYRLLSPYEQGGVASSLMYVSADKQRAVFFAYKLKHFVGTPVPQIYLQGLDPDKKYRLKEINRTDEGMSNVDGQVVSGRVLMQAGMKVNLGSEYSSRVFELTAE